MSTVDILYGVWNRFFYLNLSSLPVEKPSRDLTLDRGEQNRISIFRDTRKRLGSLACSRGSGAELGGQPRHRRKAREE